MINKHDEEQILQFLEKNKQTIQDDGFSDRVMQQLPPNSSVWGRLWQWIMGIVSVVLFFVLGGLTTMKHLFLTFLGDFWGEVASMNVSLPSPLILIIALVTLLWVAVFEAEERLKD